MHPLEHYSYTIEEKNIRMTPLTKRDESRLFVYDTNTDTITFDYFYNIAKYLPKDSLMVLNNTAVIPARVTFEKKTGGKVSGLVLVNEGFDDDGNVAVIVNRKIIPGQTLSLGEEYFFTVIRQDEQRFFLKPDFDKELLPALLERYGVTPTPPYLGKQTLEESELRARYQTIFAQEKKSVAAPTASLHFTSEVFASLEKSRIETAEITLDVGLGTFADVSQKNFDEKALHVEKFYIPQKSFETIKKSKEGGKKIVAVGTTAMRTLESNANVILGEEPHDIMGETNIFIYPPFDFKVVDILITNFHVPKSSLMALVDAFLDHKKAKRNILELYAIALNEGFSFYSFGDSMLIL